MIGASNCYNFLDFSEVRGDFLDLAAQSPLISEGEIETCLIRALEEFGVENYRISSEFQDAGVYDSLNREFRFNPELIPDAIQRLGGELRISWVRFIAAHEVGHSRQSRFFMQIGGEILTGDDAYRRVPCEMDADVYGMRVVLGLPTGNGGGLETVPQILIETPWSTRPFQGTMAEAEERAQDLAYGDGCEVSVLYEEDGDFRRVTFCG